MANLIIYNNCVDEIETLLRLFLERTRLVKVFIKINEQTLWRL